MKTINADLIIWDLDGTLIDSKKDIAFAVNETLARIDHPPISEEEIYSYVGNGVRPLIERAVAASGGGNSLDNALSLFQNIYLTHLLDTTILFDGILDVLRHFENKKMAVATNKPFGWTMKILEGLQVADLFVSIKGGDSLPTHKPDPEMVNAILREAEISAKNAVIVGDSAVDVQTGKNAGIRTIGVSYGFRPVAELIKSAPDLLVPTPLDLKKAIR